MPTVHPAFSTLAILFIAAACGSSNETTAPANVTGEPDAGGGADAGPSPEAGSRCGASACKSNEYCDFEDGACGEVNPASAICRPKPLDCGGTIFSNLLTRCTCTGDVMSDGCPATVALRADRSCFDASYFACGDGFCKRGSICANLPGAPGGSYRCSGPINGCSACSCMPETVTTTYPVSMTYQGCSCSGEGDALTVDCVRGS